jgi:TonB family protein
MKERGFDRDAEHTAAQSPGTARGATVTKLHRPTKTEKLDVDELVTDFLQALGTYSSEAEAPEIVGSETPAHDAPEPEPPARDLLKKSAPPIGPEVVPTEAKILHADVDAELDQTLREIESRPKLSIIPIPAHEIAKTPPPPRSTFETAPVPGAPAYLPVHAAEPRVAKAEPPLEAAPAGEVRIVSETKSKTGRGTLRLPLTSPPPAPSAKRRVMIGFAAVVVTAAICLAVYLSFLGKSTPAGNGSGAASHSAAKTPDAIGAQSGAAERQAAQDGLSLKAGAPAVGGAQSDPAQSARAAAPPPAVKTPGPATREDDNRTKAAPPPNVTAQSRGLEANAPDPAKQTTPPRNEAQGNNNAAVTPTQPPPPPSAPGGAKPTEPPPTAATVQTPVAPATPAKANAEPPPGEAPKVSPPAPPPTGGSAATTNPAEAGDPKTNAPAAKTAPVPLATPAEPVFKVTPTYPLTAQKMRVTGTVEVQVLIDEQGKVTKATAVSGQYVLRPAAEDALMKWKFKPATLRGVSIKSELVVSVSFIR